MNQLAMQWAVQGWLHFYLSLVNVLDADVHVGEDDFFSSFISAVTGTCLDETVEWTASCWAVGKEFYDFFAYQVASKSVIEPTEMAGWFITAVLVHLRVTVVSVVFFVMENHIFLAGWGIDAALWVFLEVPLVLGHVDVDIVPSYQLKTEEDKEKEMLHHHRSFLSEALFQGEVRDNVRTGRLKVLGRQRYFGKPPSYIKRTIELKLDLLSLSHTSCWVT